MKKLNIKNFENSWAYEEAKKQVKKERLKARNERFKRSVDVLGTKVHEDVEMMFYEAVR
jgi:hypothetical protein